MKKLLIIALSFVALCNITTAQQWDYDHSKSTINGIPTSNPYTIEVGDVLRIKVGVSPLQNPDMCGVNFWSTHICLDSLVTGCGNTPTFANMNQNIINADTFELVIVATASTGKDSAFINPQPEFDLSCGGLQGFPPSSNIRVYVIPSSTFPIELRSQAVVQIENTQDLEYSWLVATQLNNHFFTVELSKDGYNWKEMERVEGAGTTTEELAYEVLIKNVSAGYNYVRLKQTDFDGSFAYSPTLSIFVEEWSEKAELVITSASDGRNANILAQNWHNTEAESFSAELYDTRGVKVLEVLNIPKESFNNNYQIQLPEAAGVYVLRIWGASDPTKFFVGKAVKR